MQNLLKKDSKEGKAWIRAWCVHSFFEGVALQMELNQRGGNKAAVLMKE